MEGVQPVPQHALVCQMAALASHRQAFHSWVKLQFQRRTDQQAQQAYINSSSQHSMPSQCMTPRTAAAPKPEALPPITAPREQRAAPAH